MLGLYIKSVVIYFIIFLATNRLGEFITKNRKDVNYNEYLTEKINGNISCFTVSLIPIIRTIYLIIMFVVIFGTKQTLDKLFNKKGNNVNENTKDYK